MANENDDETNATEDAEEMLPLYAISSWGADYTVEVLVKRLEKDDIFIPPFQRKFVWNQVKASRFIESLIFGLPVPGIFLSKESETGRQLVIDGQQRLTTLKYFYDGIFADTGREFILKHVHDDLEGKSYKTLPPELRRRLDDSVIHSTIVKQESPQDQGSSIYQIFERLNTGGQPLKSQEIRSAVYFGDSVGLLAELNSNKNWRQIYGREAKDMRDQEYILRFLALRCFGTKYERPMTGFLNEFMNKHKKLSKDKYTELSELFNGTINVVFNALGATPFRPKKTLNVAAFDGIMVGISLRLKSKPITDLKGLKETYDTLMKDEKFLQTLEPNTTDEAKVRDRLAIAEAAFSKVK